ncbi:uncharacterized protein LACBIDRAFT_306248 [Laccaria bicolor S238N-H82]|uniref:Predicted protein n=1 Tax=Laccaria bicolor (strain S238N-H82 / ATCC MYA-4686) TaxID=486041 RepID=B0E4F7_LACBS|nr:uncharacterized protein LACBIDRAFT_306248 [Laccaria bicolor S238N-H82]EDQ98274.1 predicted protein [Laccaria bicolor S238N-H82]|eukprot:XP_001891075.1 predicted protein [Laccaria bicolor S238N-H82]
MLSKQIHSANSISTSNMYPLLLNTIILLWMSTHPTPSSKLSASVPEGMVKPVGRPWVLSGFTWIREQQTEGDWSRHSAWILHVCRLKTIYLTPA